MSASWRRCSIVVKSSSGCGRQQVLGRPAVAARVDGRIDRSGPVGLDRQGQAVRAAIVEERRQRHDPLVADAVVGRDA